MATFKALNIESDEELDDEPDNTKEIQIEEALKIYQTALKFHSLAPRTLDEAGEAYKQLFESEIFRYPESQSEYTREEVIATHQLSSDSADVEVEFVQTAPASNGENASSALPQILHLSYKNRGQYHLDRLALEQQDHVPSEEGEEGRYGRTVRDAAVSALSDFAEALDKDEEDQDLWRRAANVGEALKSDRISRFCLEGVLDEDENTADDILGASGIEASLVWQDLKRLNHKIEDELSLMDTVDTKIADSVPSVWRDHLNLPLLTLATSSTSSGVHTGIMTEIINISDVTWNGLGQAILERLTTPNNESQIPGPSRIVHLHLTADAQVLKPLRTRSDASPVEPTSATPDPRTTEPPLASTQHRVAKESPVEPTASSVTETLPNGSTTNETIVTASEPQTATHIGEQIVQEAESGALPSRKRSVDVAELPANADGSRGRSKRLRARASVIGDETLVADFRTESMTNYEWNLQESTNWDNLLFDILQGIANKCSIAHPERSQTLRDAVVALRTGGGKDIANDMPLRVAFLDLYGTMQSWDKLKDQVLLNTSSNEDSSTTTQRNGLLTFLESTTTSLLTNESESIDVDLRQWVNEMNESGGTIRDVAMRYIYTMAATNGDGRSLWSAALKQTVVHVLGLTDEHLIDCFSQTQDTSRSDTTSHGLGCVSPDNLETAEIIQGVFELYLDVCLRLKNLANEVDGKNPSLAKARLDTWSHLARQWVTEYFAIKGGRVNGEREDAVLLRHLWSSVFYLSVCEDIQREHLIACLEDLRAEIESRSSTVLGLLNNNPALPEISASAAEREISKLKTMDFFLSVFQIEGRAAVDLIEDLEPLLEQAAVEEEQTRNQTQKVDNKLEGNDEGSPLKTTEHVESASDGSPLDRNTLQDTSNVLSRFLQEASLPLRLLLWRRLRHAYEQIEYPPKVFSICLQMIKLFMDELKSSAYTQEKQNDRDLLLLEYLRECMELVRKALALTESIDDIFECLDESALQISMTTIMDLWTLLYAVALWDDYSQAGGKGGSNVNPFRFYPSERFHAASVKLHDMQIHVCLLLYKLFVEYSKQTPEIITSPVEDRLMLLRHMHFFFGVRRLCKASDSLFLRFSKDELLNLPEMSRQSSDDLAQVLYDLYDLYCFSTAHERLEHGCDADYLDRKTALQLMPYVMDKARSMSMKDLLKSELGKSIEKLHGALGAVKYSGGLAARNRKIISSYVRSAIRPLDLIRALNGIGDLSAVPMNSDDTLIASKGWFFLKGEIALAKFRAQRSKASQASEDDLLVAIAFFQSDLEYNPEHWESWFLLGQAHDALVDEHVLWSADKVNNHQSDLTTDQRIAIHAYTLAIAGALKDKDALQTKRSTVAELYYCFGNRIYASTRQPFYMRPFSLKDYAERHYFDATQDGGKYMSRSFKGLRSVNAWRLASTLFKRAAELQPKHWMTYYMLAKCLWKIHQHASAANDPRYSVDAILAAVSKAVELLPTRKDPSRQDPVLESIYKTIVLSHKMVLRGDFDSERGAKVIEDCLTQQQQFDVTTIPAYAESSSWSEYMVSILRILRAADKSRWHHRLVMRAAKIMHTIGDNPAESARRAKEYLIEQHVFSTKTLALTVWKPEHERPGRHWWYMKRYAMFLAQLLEQTDDLEAIEILARRIRKKTNEYYEHTSLWEEICNLHVKLHRRYGSVPENIVDTVFKNVDQEEFSARATLIDAWASSPTTKHKLQEVLRETAELKKLNSGLIKASAIDDLLGDTYAAIWTEIGPSLGSPEPAAPSTPPLPPLASQAPASPPSQEDKRSIMSLTNLMNIDGAPEQRPPSSRLATPPIILGSTFVPADIIIKPRPRLISRREIVKRASDTVAIKPVPGKGATTPQRQASPTRTSGLVPIVVIETNRGAGDYEMVDTDMDMEHVVAEPVSVAPSVHDDADDESELSEVDEDADDEVVVITRPTIFPNLRNGTRSGDEGDDSRRQSQERNGDDKEGVVREEDNSDVVMEEQDGEEGEENDDEEEEQGDAENEDEVEVAQEDTRPSGTNGSVEHMEPKDEELEL